MPYWTQVSFVVLLIFLIPITTAYLVNFLEKKWLAHMPKWLLISGMMSLTIGVEIGLTFLVAKQLQWPWIDAHFTVGFLLFILVWFMQFNEFIGNRMANMENRVMGDGRNIYDLTIFRFKVNPISIATLLYFFTSIISALFLFSFT